MKVYLASPFFNDREREVKVKVLQKMNELGYEVLDPQNSDNLESWELSNYDWAKDVFVKDGISITEADAVVAIDWGLYGDCGTACEVGMAVVMEKPILIIAPDETLKIPHSLMVIQSGSNFISLSRFLNFKRDWFSDKTKPFFLYGVEEK